MIEKYDVVETGLPFNFWVGSGKDRIYICDGKNWFDVTESDWKETDLGMGFKYWFDGS